MKTDLLTRFPAHSDVYEEFGFSDKTPEEEWSTPYAGQVIFCPKEQIILKARQARKLLDEFTQLAGVAAEMKEALTKIESGITCFDSGMNLIQYDYSTVKQTALDALTKYQKLMGDE